MLCIITHMKRYEPLVGHMIGIISHMKRYEPLERHMIGIIAHMKRYKPLEAHTSIAFGFCFIQHTNRVDTNISLCCATFGKGSKPY